LTHPDVIALGISRMRKAHGLDDETKISDFPVEGELFLSTSSFIERSENR